MVTIQSLLNTPVLTVWDCLFLGFLSVVIYGVSRVLEKVIRS